MTNDLLQGVPQLEQAFCSGGGQIASSKLQNPKPAKRPKRKRRRVSGRRRQYRNDLEGGQEPENPPKLLERSVVAEVRDVGSEIVDGSAGQEALELKKGLEPRVHVMEARRVQLEH